MPISKFEEITEMQKSMLQEICNMGAGSAATSVSKMVSAPTDIGVPQVKINPPSLAARIADMLSKNAAVYHIKLTEDVPGSLLFIIPYPFIERLAADYFPDIKIEDENSINEMISSFVGETVNISAAAYANAFADMTRLTVDISTPEIVTVPSEKLLSAIKSGTAQVCFVNNSIEILDCHKNYTVMYYPEVESVNKILRSFGLEN